MSGRVAIYSIGIGIAVLATIIYRHLVMGVPIAFDRLLLACLLLPVFGFLIWLRWDWAPAEGRKARAARQREDDKP